MQLVHITALRDSDYLNTSLSSFGFLIGYRFQNFRLYRVSINEDNRTRFKSLEQCDSISFKLFRKLRQYEVS